MTSRGAMAAALTIALSIGSTGAAAAAAWADTGAPYTDTHVDAGLALCGKDGRPVMSGSVDSRPFVWRAVSSQAAPAPYNRSGRTATLFAYQPRPQVDAGQWSGDLLTASARYTDAAHPMAQATDLDGSLSEFLDAYPTKIDGFVQLRLYLGAPGQPAFTERYAAANIQVTGNQWHLVGSPAALSCTSGSAVSLEVLLPSTKPSPGESAAAANASASADPPASHTAAGSAAPVASATTVAGQAIGVRVADSSDGWLNSLVVLLLAVAAVVSVLWWWWPMRRRTGDVP